MTSTWISILAGLVGVVGIAAKYLWSRRERETGRLESTNEAQRIELRNAKMRAEIDAEVRGLSTDAVSNRLSANNKRD